MCETTLRDIGISVGLLVFPVKPLTAPHKRGCFHSFTTSTFRCEWDSALVKMGSYNRDLTRTFVGRVEKSLHTHGVRNSHVDSAP